MNVIVYTKDDCKYCNLAKGLLETKGIGYNEVNVGKDITREEFVDTFPNVKTMPYIIVDQIGVGGYSQLSEWMEEQDYGRQQLNESS